MPTTQLTPAINHCDLVDLVDRAPQVLNAVAQGIRRPAGDNVIPHPAHAARVSAIINAARRNR